MVLLELASLISSLYDLPLASSAIDASLSLNRYTADPGTYGTIMNLQGIVTRSLEEQIFDITCDLMILQGA